MIDLMDDLVDTSDGVNDYDDYMYVYLWLRYLYNKSFYVDNQYYQDDPM